MSCDKAVGQFKYVDTNLVNNSNFTLYSNVARFFSNFHRMPAEHNLINSNENLVPQTDGCISIDANPFNNNMHMTYPKYGLTNQRYFNEQYYNTVTRYMGYANTGMTPLHTNTTGPIAPTIISAYKFDSNKKNYTAQIQSNEGAQPILHKNIEANASNATAFAYDTKAINHAAEIRQCIPAYCNKCGVRYWCRINLKNRICPNCFDCTLDEDGFVNSNGKIVVPQTDECISIDTNMTDPNYALTSSSKDDSISNQDNFTEQYKTETKCNGHANTGMTLLHTDATEPIAPTIISADEFDSNKQNHIAQMQSNEGGQQILHEANTSNATASAYDAKIIDSVTEIGKFIVIYCTNCGDTQFNHSYLNNRECPKCGTKRTLRCAKCRKQYDKYNSIYEHLRRKCHPKMLYQCSRCGHNTHDKWKMERHLNIQRHNSPKDITCKGRANTEANASNPTAFAYDAKIIDSVTEIGKFIVICCIKCGKTQFNRSYLNNRECPKCGTKRTLRCAKCGKQYDKYISIYAHLRRKCHPKMLYQCSQCGYNTHDKNKIERHLIQRHNSPKDITRKGRKDDFSVQSLNDIGGDQYLHTNIEANSRDAIVSTSNAYVIDNENDEFDSNKENLIGRTQSNVGGQDVLPKNIVANPSDNTASTAAGTVDVVSDTLNAVVPNSVEKCGRQDDAVLRLSKLIIIYCKNCRHSSPWKNKYRKNMYCLGCKTKRSVRCRTCGYECYGYQTMRFHLTQNCLVKEYIAPSGPAKKFKCPVCLEMFSKTYLDAHPCKVRCSACSKMFANRRTLKYHEDHSCPKFSYDGNRISCPDCGNVLKTKKVLSSHKSKYCKGKSAQVRDSF